MVLHVDIIPLEVVGYHEAYTLRVTLSPSNGDHHNVLLDQSLSQLPIFSKLIMWWRLWFLPKHPTYCVFIPLGHNLPSSSLNCSHISFKTHGPSTTSLLRQLALLTETYDSFILFNLLLMYPHTPFRGLFVRSLFHVSWQRILQVLPTVRRNIT